MNSPDYLFLFVCIYVVEELLVGKTGSPTQIDSNEKGGESSLHET